jgi:hypothetical protein
VRIPPGLRAAVVLLSASTASPPVTAATFPSPEQTRAELEAVCRRLRGSTLDAAYFDEEIVRSLRGRLPGARENAALEARLRLALGWNLNRLGRHEEALTELERGRTLLPALPASERPDLGREIDVTLVAAHLQLAEELNCVGRHTATSCILPISPAAVHRLPEHARAAGDVLRGRLREEPGDRLARWLLNVSAAIAGDADGLPRELRLAEGALASRELFPVWPEASSELGITVLDLAGGAIADDFDGDGLLDLVSSTVDPCGPLKAYRNTGRGTFEDVAAQWGLDSQLGGLNLVHADYDGDGALDLLVLRGGWLGRDGRIRNSLLRNDLDREAGRFVDATFAAGLAYPAYPTQAAAWADHDGDGDLDLYVGNEGPLDSPRRSGRYGSPEGPAYPSQLFRNDGDGTFTDIAASVGITNDRFAKGVAWGDIDDDGDPDLYVSNLGPNRLYRNAGNGAFADVAEAAGVLEPAERSFATWFFDFDNDGDLDLYVGDYSATAEEVVAPYFGEGNASGNGSGHPVIYRNDGGRFTDVSAALGLHAPLLPMGANHGDLDNDGWLDVYLGTGEPALDALMPNVMLRNDGGRRFEDVTFAGGFGHLQKGHGVAFGDLDNDGDQDLYHQLGGSYPADAYGNALWLNPGNEHHWLVLRLRGAKANRFAVGARIEVRLREGDAVRSVHALAGSGGSFGGSSLQQEIGLGAADAIEELLIRWPGTTVPQRFTEIAMDRYYRATEGSPALEPLSVTAVDLGGAEPAVHAHSTERP